MSEPIVEVTRVNIYGDARDEHIIAHKVKMDSTTHNDWLKQNEAEALMGYIEGKMERDFDDALVDNLAGVVGYAEKCREIRRINGDGNK